MLNFFITIIFLINLFYGANEAQKSASGLKKESEKEK